MKFFQKVVVKLSAVSALFLLPFSAFAGSGTIVFGPVDPSAIPTLSSTMLIVLSVLLVLVAFRVSKQKGSGKLLVTLLGASVLMASTGGIKLVSDLEAGGATPIQNPEGQTFDLFSGNRHSFRNTSDVLMKVLEINLPTTCNNYPNTSLSEIQDCNVGLILDSSPVGGPFASLGGFCIIDCSEPPEGDL